MTAMTLSEQIASLTHHEQTLLRWLGRDVSDIARKALEEDLRRNREQQRSLTLRQFHEQELGDNHA